MASPMTSCSSPDSPVIDLPRPWAVVCHDAGGANALLALLAAAGAPAGIRAYMTGPALTAWRQRFGTAPMAASLDVALSGAGSVLTGTGWATSLEHDARALAKQRGLPSAALLDHWVNYAQRFTRDGQTVLPDQIWVTDAQALRIARDEFPCVDLRLQPDCQMQEQLEGIRDVRTAPQTLLYLLEPARDDWGHGRPGEFQALDYFASRWPLAGVPATARVVLRPHPSDPAGKYAGWIESQTEFVTALEVGGPLREALSGALWVAGCESHAMVVALAAGRTVFGTLPPWAPRCRLPQPGIIHLRDA